MSKVIQFCTPLLPTCTELYFLADQVIHTSWSLYRPGNSQRNCGASPAHWDSRVQVTIFRKIRGREVDSMLECAFQAGLAFCLLSQIPPELWRGHRKLFLVDFVFLYLCGCVSVCLSSFRDFWYMPFIWSQDHVRPHILSLFVCPSRKDLTSWVHASWMHASWIHTLWIHALWIHAYSCWMWLNL